MYSDFGMCLFFIIFAPRYQDFVGDASPLFYWNVMIEKEIIEGHLREILSTKDIFLVEVKVDSSSKIRVHIDKMEGISIDDCVGVSRELEGKLDRDQEDFALEVSSPGLDAPFRVREQYVKNSLLFLFS